MKIVVTGSSGLVGSEAAEYFDRLGCSVHGIDNNMRKLFFGPQGDTTWNLERLKKVTKNYIHHNVDIRDFEKIETLFKKERFDVVIHCAAQPSHDKAREIPLVDFGVNATGTLNLLEAARRFVPNTTFIHMSTNKVYGDAPNELELVELETRWDYANERYYAGIDEDFRIDQSLHSLFGASKLAADIFAQEYARTFKMKVCIFRAGCVTGPQHSGVELHGFLSYLVKAALNHRVYNIYGYEGKQVRDQIHSYDVIRAMEEFVKDPRPGIVYNLGGGRENSISVLESIYKIQEITKDKINYTYKKQSRLGDHICYISNLAKFRSDYPNWKITRSLEGIIAELIDFERI